ncbi:MAG: AMP-binding protein, partial [Anaerolineae bacterium]
MPNPTWNMTDYDKAYAEFEWERPDKFNFARDVVDKWAAEDPDLQALLWVDDDGNEKRMSYADVSVESRKLCNVLTGLGVKRGDVVVIMLSRESEWWTISTACLRMGAILSPGTSQMTPKDIEYRINRADATCFITSEVYAERYEAVADQCPTMIAPILIGPERDGWKNYAAEVGAASDQFETVDTDHDENAICYFTSGTTGYPKMTLHTHTSYPLGHVSTGKYWLDNRPGQLHWNISDTGWAKAAWSSFFGPWNMGATVFVHHTKGFSADGILDMLEKYPVNILCGPPTVYRMLVQQDLSSRDFSNLRYCIGAGEPLNPE